MFKTPICYVELPSQDVAASKLFYGSLFGWSFQDFGPDYAAFSDAAVEGGFNGQNSHRTKAPLVVLETDGLESMCEKVKAAGGTITLPIFSFPGGRRFHFIDPSGNELAVMQKA
jgi:uncharacterized protein